MEFFFTPPVIVKPQKVSIVCGQTQQHDQPPSAAGDAYDSTDCCYFPSRNIVPLHWLQKQIIWRDVPSGTCCSLQRYTTLARKRQLIILTNQNNFLAWQGKKKDTALSLCMCVYVCVCVCACARATLIFISLSPSSSPRPLQKKTS